MITPLPNCLGCIFLDEDGTCGHWHKAKITRTKLGIFAGPSGGCALYRCDGVAGSGRASTDYDNRVRELYDKGYDDPSIAKETGFSRNAIYRWRHRHGLPSNGKPGDWRKKKPVS